MRTEQINFFPPFSKIFGFATGYTVWGQLPSGVWGGDAARIESGAPQIEQVMWHREQNFMKISF